MTKTIKNPSFYRKLPYGSTPIICHQCKTQRWRRCGPCFPTFWQKRLNNINISSKQITNSIIWNKNNKQNKQPSLPVARPASSSPPVYYNSQSMNILFLLVDYYYIVFTYKVSYMEFS